MTAPAEPEQDEALRTDRQEALSTAHARDTFRLRRLTSGAWAIWDQTITLIAIVPDLPDIVGATEHLRLAADASRQQAEAERQALARRVAESQLLDNLELDI